MVFHSALGKLRCPEFQSKQKSCGGGGCIKSILGSELNAVTMIKQAFDCGKNNMTQRNKDPLKDIQIYRKSIII